ncbi:Uncharacterised protein [Burkholderia pseudomallei]|nr:Uncharacterised protein [Burkholderia pseudomallei]
MSRPASGAEYAAGSFRNSSHASAALAAVAAIPPASDVAQAAAAMNGKYGASGMSAPPKRTSAACSNVPIAMKPVTAA